MADCSSLIRSMKPAIKKYLSNNLALCGQLHPLAMDTFLLNGMVISELKCINYHNYMMYLHAKRLVLR